MFQYTTVHLCHKVKYFVMQAEEPGSQLDACSIGCVDNSKCHLVSLSKKCGLKSLNDFSPEHQLLIRHRCGLEFSDTSQICLHHEALLLKKMNFCKNHAATHFKRGAMW